MCVCVCLYARACVCVYLLFQPPAPYAKFETKGIRQAVYT